MSGRRSRLARRSVPFPARPSILTSLRPGPPLRAPSRQGHARSRPCEPRPAREHARSRPCEPVPPRSTPAPALEGLVPSGSTPRPTLEGAVPPGSTPGPTLEGLVPPGSTPGHALGAPCPRERTWSHPSAPSRQGVRSVSPSGAVLARAGQGWLSLVDFFGRRVGGATVWKASVQSSASSVQSTVVSRRTPIQPRWPT